jgi:hypothetical protein
VTSRRLLSREDEKAQMNWRSTIGNGNTQASTNDEKTQMNWRPTTGSGNTQASADDEKTQMNWWPSNSPPSYFCFSTFWRSGGDGGTWHR